MEQRRNFNPVRIILPRLQGGVCVCKRGLSPWHSASSTPSAEGHKHLLHPPRCPPGIPLPQVHTDKKCEDKLPSPRMEKQLRPSLPQSHSPARYPHPGPSPAARGMMVVIQRGSISPWGPQ